MRQWFIAFLKAVTITVSVLTTLFLLTVLDLLLKKWGAPSEGLAAVMAAVVVLTVLIKTW